MKNMIIGGIIVVLAAAVIIFIFESGRSFLQFLIGFLLFIIPATFISSFKSTFMSFLFVLFTILVMYVIYAFNFLDAILGIVLAIIVGGYIFYTIVNKYRPFSAMAYKNAAIHKAEEN